MAQDQRRNLNPHKAARMAMFLYASRYAAQNGGSMDFWEKLSEFERDNCRGCVEQIQEAPEESRG